MELHVSTFILDEVARVLSEKFGWEDNRVGRVLAQLRRVGADVHEPEESVDVIEDDPTDNRILECALAASAQIIVTGDKKHLLPLGSSHGVSIVGLRNFLVSFSPD